jgi:hypothetical protein
MKKQKKTQSLKELIKDRRAATGESHAEARRQILVQQRRCTRCKTPLQTVVAGHRQDEVSEEELDDATDGQLSDYFDEVENPSIGNNWSHEALVQLCPTCEELPPVEGPPRLLDPDEPAPRPRRKV